MSQLVRFPNKRSKNQEIRIRTAPLELDDGRLMRVTKARIDLTPKTSTVVTLDCIIEEKENDTPQP